MGEVDGLVRVPHGVEPTVRLTIARLYLEAGRVLCRFLPRGVANHEVHLVSCGQSRSEGLEQSECAHATSLEHPHVHTHTANH